MSKARISFRTVVEVDLDLNKVEKYLKFKGWVDDGPYGPYARIFINKKYDDAAIKFLLTDKVADFSARMSDLVNELADYEERSVPDVIKDLQGVKE
jgi:hypothetical protein